MQPYRSTRHSESAHFLSTAQLITRASRNLLLWLAGSYSILHISLYLNQLLLAAPTTRTPTCKQEQSLDAKYLSIAMRPNPQPDSLCGRYDDSIEHTYSPARKAEQSSTCRCFRGQTVGWVKDTRYHRRSQALCLELREHAPESTRVGGYIPRASEDPQSTRT